MSRRQPVASLTTNMPFEGVSFADGLNVSRLAFHTLGTALLSMAATIGMSVITARVLGPHDKGAYDLVLATSALLAMVAGMSLSAGVTYVVAQDRSNVRRLNRRLVLIALAQSIFAGALVWVVFRTPFAAAFVPPGAGFGVGVAIVLIVLLTVLQSNARAVMMGRRQIGRANHLELTGRMTQLGLFLLGFAALIRFGREPVAAHFIWLLVASAALTTSLFLAGANSGANGATFRDSGLGEAMRYSIACYAANMAQFLNYRLAVFFIGFFAGVQAVGFYAISAMIAQLLWMLPQAAASVLLPTIAAMRESAGAGVTLASGMSRSMIAVAPIAAVAVAALATPVTPLVFGASFTPSLTPLYWLLPGVIALAPAIVLAAYFSGIGRPDINLRSSLAGLAVTVALGLLLIPRLGIKGAAIATAMSYVISAAVLARSFSQETGLSPRAFLVPRSQDLAIAADYLRQWRGRN